MNKFKIQILVLSIFLTIFLSFGQVSASTINPIDKAPQAQTSILTTQNGSENFKLESNFSGLLSSIITLQDGPPYDAYFPLFSSTSSSDSSQVSLTINESTGVRVSVSSDSPYYSGDQVTLTPIMDSGYAFAGWTGDASGTTNPLSITLQGNLTIGATASVPSTKAYYVSTSGNDANPGTFDKPFRNIQHAINLANTPGDLILVMPGEYHSGSTDTYDSLIVENKNGLPGHEIVIRAYDPTQKPVIVNRSGGFRVIHSSYVIIEGFEFKDYTQTGIGLYVSNNISIKNNYMHLSLEGICQSGEGLPLCKADGTGVGQIKGRINNFGQYILEHDGSQNTGVYVCKSQDNLISGNRIDNLDEAIYIGTAYAIESHSCWTSYAPRTWASGNVVENNLIHQAMNEGIELKPDAIRSTVKGNVIKNTGGLGLVSIEIRSAYNDVFENVIYGDNQYSKIGIRLLEEPDCNNPPNDEFGNSMSLYPDSSGGYICTFGNRVHHNYIYYTQGNNYAPAIYNYGSATANTLDHNTIVGGNDFGIINDASSSTITNNLIIGYRGTKSSLLTQFSYSRPTKSDFNAYYPSKKTNGGCTVSIYGETISCENGQNSVFEVNSIFMPSSPVGSFQPTTSPLKIDGVCAPSSLSTLSLGGLKDRIESCSIPVNNAYGNQIVNKASDGTTIGASQDR